MSGKSGLPRWAMLVTIFAAAAATFSFFVVPLLFGLAFQNSPHFDFYSQVTLYALDGEESCKKLPLVAAAGGSATWDSATKSCTVPREILFRADYKLAVGEGITLKIVRPGGIVVEMDQHGGKSDRYGGNIENKGNIVVETTGDIDLGGIANMGTVSIRAGNATGIMENRGAIYIENGAVLGGNIANGIREDVEEAPFVLARGGGSIFVKDGGSLKIYGGSALDNYGSISVSGAIYNNDHIGNYGSISASGNGVIKNAGVFESYHNSTIDNAGSGSISNFDVFRLYDGILINRDNATLTNYHAFSSTGAIHNRDSATFDNTIGTMTNGGTFHNDSAMLNRSGAFLNYGAFYNGCAGVIEGDISENPPVDSCYA